MVLAHLSNNPQQFSTALEPFDASGIADRMSHCLQLPDRPVETESAGPAKGMGMMSGIGTKGWPVA